MRTTLLMTLIALSSNVLNASAQAECPEINPEVAATATKSGALCHEGKMGVWFPQETAKKMAADLKKAEADRKLIAILESRIAISDEAFLKLEKQLEVQRMITGEWEKVAKAQTKALSKRRAWYKSPTLWFAIGVVATTGLGYGTAKLYNATR